MNCYIRNGAYTHTHTRTHEAMSDTMNSHVGCMHMGRHTWLSANDSVMTLEITLHTDRQSTVCYRQLIVTVPDRSMWAAWHMAQCKRVRAETHGFRQVRVQDGPVHAHGRETHGEGR